MASKRYHKNNAEDSMNNSNILYFFLLLAFFIPLIATAQMQEERRLEEIEQEMVKIEHRLGDELHPDDRSLLEQRFEGLHEEKRELKEFLEDRGRNELPIEPPDGKELSPTIVAAIIGALGAIIVALIGLMRRK